MLIFQLIFGWTVLVEALQSIKYSLIALYIVIHMFSSPHPIVFALEDQSIKTPHYPSSPFSPSFFCPQGISSDGFWVGLFVVCLFMGGVSGRAWYLSSPCSHLSLIRPPKIFLMSQQTMFFSHFNLLTWIPVLSGTTHSLSGDKQERNLKFSCLLQGKWDL